MMSLQCSLPDSCISTIQGDSERWRGGCVRVREMILEGSLQPKKMYPDPHPAPGPGDFEPVIMYL